MKSITFLMPPFQYSPVGGFKIVFEYANELSNEGYDVHIVYADKTKYKHLPLFLYLKLYLKHILFKLKFISRSAKIWFPLNERITEHNVFSLDYRFVPKTDIYICTSVDTAPYLEKYPIDNNQKFYFIQDYENWGRTDQEVRNTYHYKMNKIVISKWLLNIVTNEEAEKCTLVPNGFNLKEFYLTIPIKEKCKYSVSMLYHWADRKGCPYAFKALDIVKRNVPQLQVYLFGTPEKPMNLPDWYHYCQTPSKEEHLRINNECAIYIAASIDEGWGLTIGEAMLCGQAVACTDNKGFREMATHNVNALLSPVKDVITLANNIQILINNDNLRFQLAYNGIKTMKNYSLDESYMKFKSALNLES